MDREACRVAVHGVAKSRTQLSNWTELNIRYDILMMESIVKRHVLIFVKALL